MDDIRKKEIDKLLNESRQEPVTSHYGPVMGCNYPNHTERALVEVQYELLSTSLDLSKVQTEMLKESQTLRMWTIGLAVLTVVLIVLTGVLLLKG